MISLGHVKALKTLFQMSTKFHRIFFAFLFSDYFKLNWLINYIHQGIFHSLDAIYSSLLGERGIKFLHYATFTIDCWCSLCDKCRRKHLSNIMNQLGKHDFSRGSVVNNLKDRKRFCDQMNKNRFDPIPTRCNWNCSTM